MLVLLGIASPILDLQNRVQEAAEHFGWFAMFAGIDAPKSSARTPAALGWRPEYPGLITDIDHPAYFAQ